MLTALCCPALQFSASLGHCRWRSAWRSTCCSCLALFFWVKNAQKSTPPCAGGAQLGGRPAAHDVRGAHGCHRWAVSLQLVLCAALLPERAVHACARSTGRSELRALMLDLACTHVWHEQPSSPPCRHLRHEPDLGPGALGPLQPVGSRLLWPAAGRHAAGHSGEAIALRWPRSSGTAGCGLVWHVAATAVAHGCLPEVRPACVYHSLLCTPSPAQGMYAKALPPTCCMLASAFSITYPPSPPTPPPTGHVRQAQGAALPPKLWPQPSQLQRRRRRRGRQCSWRRRAGGRMTRDVPAACCPGFSGLPTSCLHHIVPFAFTCVVCCEAPGALPVESVVV